MAPEGVQDSDLERQTLRRLKKEGAGDLENKLAKKGFENEENQDGFGSLLETRFIAISHKL